jgi:polysaccharide export outer membrane protein
MRGRPMSLRFLPLVLVAWIAFTGCRGPGIYVDARDYIAKHPPMPAKADRIRVGDVLNVQVFGEPTLSMPQVAVRPHGAISLPLLGEQPAAGLTPDELAKRLSRALDAYLKDARVTVILVSSTVVVHVIGEVSSAGKREFPRPVPILDVLAESGGLTQYANRKGIYLLRGSDRIRFDYYDLIRGSASVRNFLVESGDVLVVE